MVGKVISASSFSGTVGYVMKEESRILEAEGIMPPEVKDMVQDFKDQTLLNPRLKNTVGHISLSFSPKDAPRMTDALMTRPIRTAIWSTTGSETTGKPFRTRTSKSATPRSAGS